MIRASALSNESFGTLKLGDIHSTMQKPDDSGVMQEFPDSKDLLRDFGMNHYYSPEALPNTFPGDYQIKPALLTMLNAQERLNGLIDSLECQRSGKMKFLHANVVFRDSRALTRSIRILNRQAALCASRGIQTDATR